MLNVTRSPRRSEHEVTTTYKQSACTTLFIYGSIGFVVNIQSLGKLGIQESRNYGKNYFSDSGRFGVNLL